MVEGDAWSVEMPVVLSDGCSVRLAVLVCRVFGRDVVDGNVLGGGGSRSFDFRLRPLLFLLPSHVVAHLLLGRVVSLRLGSDGGVQIDLAVVPVRLPSVVSVSSVACLATVLSVAQSPLNQSSRGAVAVSPGLPASRWRLPGLPWWVTWLWN